jgi:hypothetical protein
VGPSLLLSAHGSRLSRWHLICVFAGSWSTSWLRALPLAYKQDEGHISAATVGHLHELGGGRSSPSTLLTRGISSKGVVTASAGVRIMKWPAVRVQHRETTGC